MSLLSENVIPGNHGQIFETNAKKEFEIENVTHVISKIDGILKVTVKTDVFPVEINVYTSKMVAIKEIQKEVRAVGYHVIPKSIFPF